MKIAAWLLEPLHWLKVVLAVALWFLVAPILWDMLRGVASLPGGGEALFAAGGFVFVLARVMRRSRSRGVTISTSPMPAQSQHEQERSPQVTTHIARHEAAHAVVAWAAGARVLSVDVIPILNSGGRCSAQLPGERLVQDAWIRLQLTLASVVEDGRNQIRSLGGASDDVAQAVTQVAVIIATGQRPDGFEGALTFDGLIGGAAERARQHLDEHEDLIEALTTRLLADPATALIDPDLEGMRRELNATRREPVPS